MYIFLPRGVTVLHSGESKTEALDYIIVANNRTGKRIKVSLADING
jgi:hypothetical protein